jgi:hypothetical protein
LSLGRYSASVPPTGENMSRHRLIMSVGVLLVGGLLTVGWAAETQLHHKPITVPFNAAIQAKNTSPVYFSGTITLPPPVSLNISPGSTLQLGQGTTLAVNGPMIVGGNFVLNGTITIPKGAILSESQLPIGAIPDQRPHAGHEVKDTGPTL